MSWCSQHKTRVLTSFLQVLEHAVLRAQEQRAGLLQGRQELSLGSALPWGRALPAEERPLRRSHQLQEEEARLQAEVRCKRSPGARRCSQPTVRGEHRSRPTGPWGAPGGSRTRECLVHLAEGDTVLAGNGHRSRPPPAGGAAKWCQGQMVCAMLLRLGRWGQVRS